MIKIPNSFQFYLSLAALFSTILGCHSPDGSTGVTTPSTTGDSAYVQLSYQSGSTQATALTRLYRNGQKLSLVGGDLLVVTHNGVETLLFGGAVNSGVYGGTLPSLNTSMPVDFDIQYRPKEVRGGRWYPSDIAYVDKGPGEYVGQFNWATNFLNITVEMPSPTGDQVYNYDTDLVTIQWQVTGPQTAMVSAMRLMAFHSCRQSIVQIYETAGADKLSGTQVITIRELFTGIDGNNFAKLSRDLVSQLNSNYVAKYTSSGECDVTIYAFAESHGALPAPFDAGDLVTSVYQLSKLRFVNLGRFDPIVGLWKLL